MQDVEEEDAAVPTRRQNHARVERMRGQLENESRVSPDRVEKLAGSGIPHLQGARKLAGRSSNSFTERASY